MENITPIHKSGSRSCFENYRGITIIPTLGELFELLVCRELTYEIKNYISSCQLGFVTSTNLVEFVNHAINVVESGAQLDSFSDSRRIACNCFFFDLFSGRVNYFPILSAININIPARSLRNFTFLRHEFHRTDYGNSEPVTNMITLFRWVSYLFDVSHTIMSSRLHVILFLV